MNKGDDRQELPDRVAAGFHKISLVLRHEAWKAAGGRGLSPTQAQILSTLSTAGSPLRLGDLAREIGLTPGTVSEAVRVLVEKDLVQKSSDEHDQRAVAIRLTRKGKREAAHDSGALSTIVTAAKSLSAEQQAGLVVGLVATIRSLQEQGQVPVARMCVGCVYFRPHAHRAAKKAHHCQFVDAAIGDEDLRFDCGDFESADERDSQETWAAFSEGRPVSD